MDDKFAPYKRYRVGVNYQEGAVLTIYADSPEQAKEKAKEILDDTEADYPYVDEQKIVHRETMVTDVKEMEDN
jgi:CO/xanthine dehydrogenase Mo-binding subunit